MPSNKFQSAAKSYTSSNKFIEDYEKLLKKNTGSRLLFSTDTGFNPAYNLTNKQVTAPVYAEGGLSSPEYSTNFQKPQRQYEPLPELPPEPEGQVLGDWTLPENPTPEQMLQAIFHATWEPQLPTTEELEQRYRETGQVYAIRSNQDGTVTYNDGTIGQLDPEEPPIPIASMVDGTVLWSDGFTREMPPEGLSQYLAGVSGLSQFIFGQDQTVTQGYGNYNPTLEPGSGYNYGTDFRTRDLSQRNLYAPVPLEIVQIFQDDGTRWGDISGHQGYGNSVLVRLPSGEMLRLSHLSSMGNLQVGQVLNPGDLIGTPGSTGNTAGEHLDVEYYNLDGQIDNPNNFRANASQYSVANQIVGTSPYQPQQEAPQTQNEMPAFTSPLLDTVENTAQRVVAPVKQAVQQVGKTAEQGINQWNPTGTFDLGISEGVTTPEANQARLNTVMTGSVGQTNPIRYLAGNALEKAGDMLGAPEGTLSELVAGTQTRRTNIANASDGNYQALPGSPYLGDKYAPNLLGDVSRAVDYTKDKAGNLISTAAKSVDDYADKVTAQAGRGISQLKQGLTDVVPNIFKKPQVADVGAKKVVGEDGMQGENQSASSLLDMNKVGREQDNRDAFFKYGGAETYKDYLNPGINSGYRGALNFNLFKDSVFDSPDTVGNIFGNTYLGEEATGKYKARETAKYPLMSFTPMDYQEGYDNGDIDRYNQESRSQIDQYNNSVNSYLGSIPKVFSGTNWQMGSPKSAKNVFSQASLAYKAPQMSVEPKPQMSMARPQMSVAPKPKANPVAPKPQMSIAPAKPAPKPISSPANANMSTNNGAVYSAPKPQMSVAPKPTPKLAPMSYAKPMSVAPKKAPYPIASMANGKIRYSDGSIR